MKSASIIRAASLAVATVLAGSVSAQTLYWGGGTANIADGTPLPNTPAGGLTGTWDDTLLNWSNAYSPTVYQAWSSGAFVNLGYSTDGTSDAAVTVDGNKTFSGMVASLTSANGVNRRFALNGAAAGTQLTLSGPEALFLISSSDFTRRVEFNSANNRLSFGASSTKLVKDGGGTLQLGSAGGVAFDGSAFTGDVLVRSGVLNLAASGSTLTGAPKFDLVGFRPNVNYGDANGNQAFTAPTLAFNNGNGDQLNDNAVFNLTRGRISINGNSNGNETIGSVVFKTAGIINASTGSAGGVLNIGSLSRGPDGRGTGVIEVTNGDAMVTALRITSPGSIPTDTLLPWLSTNRGEWVLIDSANNNQVTRIASSAALTDASAWSGNYDNTSNIRVQAALTNNLNADTTVNSLGFQAATTLNLGDGTNNYTLTLNSGALGFSGVGVTIQNGNLQTPGNTPLYINGGWTNSGGLNLNAKLTGTMDIYYTGQTSLTIAGNAGPNDYTGTLYIQSGTVNANKAGAINGDVIVNTGAGLQIGNAGGIASGANVTIEKDGLLRVNASTANLTGLLTVNGGVISMGTQSIRTSGGFAFNGGVINSAVNGTTVRQLELNSDVSYAATSPSQAVIQWNPSAAFTTAGFNVQLSPLGGPATRTFNIADSTLHNKSEMLIDVPIIDGAGTAPVGTLVKTGDGVLELTAANTYTGGTIVNGGELRLGTISAAAQSNLVGTFSNGGVEAQVLTFVAPITGSMAVGQPVSGTNIAAGRVIARILNDYQVILSETVGSAASTSATNISLGAVNRVGSLAGNVTVNNNAVLRMDAGSSVAGDVALNDTSTLKGNGTVGGSVSVASGATVAPGNSVGTLTVSTNATFNAGSNFDVEIASASSFDQLVVTGAALFNGNVNVTFLGGFEPSNTDVFTIIAGSNVTGTVGNLNGQGKLPVPGGTFDVEFSAAGLLLKNFSGAISFILGDMNDDSTVNNQDIAPFVLALTDYPGYQAAYPGLDGVARGDINQDSVLNNQDIAPFVALLTGGRPLADFANDPEFAPLISLVPEPASLGLLALGGLALRRRRVR